MMAVGLSLSLYQNSTYPVANQGGMTPDDALKLELAQIDHRGYSNLFGIIAAIGFLMMLISFGLKRKKGRAGKTVTQKPAAEV